jgi:phosphoribosyl 1,2-cyclic phosphate phosphodiesterase
MKALHAPKLGSLNYIIERDDRRLLYLVDSGYPTDETLAFLKNLKMRFDAVIMDGTMGYAPLPTYQYHMAYEDNKNLKEQLIAMNVADTDTRFVVTHITHNKSEYHEKVEEIFAGTGIEVAYDGFEVEI